MSCVFPGFPEVFAILFRSQIILMSDDFPTLERPMKAYSGNAGAGHFVTSVLLTTNCAILISIFVGKFIYV
jgi:hypothetical protein